MDELIKEIDVRNRINKIICGCMTRGMSSEATTDEVWEYLSLNRLANQSTLESKHEGVSEATHKMVNEHNCWHINDGDRKIFNESLTLSAKHNAALPVSPDKEIVAKITLAIHGLINSDRLASDIAFVYIANDDLLSLSADIAKAVLEVLQESEP